MKSFLQALSKKTKFGLIALALLFSSIAPVVADLVAAAGEVRLESFTHAQNISKNPDTPYGDNTTLAVDEVARVQVWYHNRELADSGKVADNLRVKLNIPESAGTNHTITGTTSADNADPVSDTTRISLTTERARLQIVPNSATWRYNKGAMDGRTECQTGNERVPSNDPHNCYTTVPLSAADQAALLSPQGLKIQEELLPCFAYEATLTVQVRAVADVISVNKMVRPFGGDEDDWVKSLDVKPGDHVEYLIQFVNQGNTTLNDVTVGDNLPLYHEFVPGYTYIDTSSTDPERITNDTEIIEDGGRSVGDYRPGAYASVWFRVKILEDVYEKCGHYLVRNVGIVNAAELPPYYNTADVNINNECEDEEPEEPQYSCDLLEIRTDANRKVTITEFDYTARNGAVFKDAVISWGDGSSDLTTNNVVGQTHTYSGNGPFTVSATARFTVDGQERTATSAACQKVVNFSTPPETPEEPEEPEQPEELPVTGPASVASIFVATSTLGALGHRLFIRRRLGL